VADKPEVLAQQILALLRNPERRALLGSAGRALVEAEYDWERCGAALLHLLGTLERL